MKLSRAMEYVCGILGLTDLIHRRLRLPKHGPELDPVVGKALTQNFQQADLLHFPAKALYNLLLAVGAVYLLVLLPLLRLAYPDERKESAGIQRLISVECRWVTLLIAAVCSEVFLYILLKAFFFVVEVGHDVHLIYPYISIKLGINPIKAPTIALTIAIVHSLLDNLLAFLS